MREWSHQHDLQPDGSEIPAADKHKYVLYQMDYATIKTFDTGSKFYEKFPHQEKLLTHKPLLSDLIASVGYRPRVGVEEGVANFVR